MKLVDDALFQQKLDLFFKELNYRTGTVEIYSLRDEKADCEFVLTYHKKEELFMYVVQGGDKKSQRKLLKKALKELRSNILKADFYKLDLDDIYDITSLTSDSNIFCLCKKIRLVLDGVLN